MHTRNPRGGITGYAGLPLFNGVYPLKLHRMPTRVCRGEDRVRKAMSTGRPPPVNGS